MILTQKYKLTLALPNHGVNETKWRSIVSKLHMLVGARGRLNDDYQLTLSVDNKPIEKISKQKLLGVFVDENLTWTAHIDYLCSLLSTKISLLKKLAAYVPKDRQQTFYQTYILSLLDYGCNTWGNTSSSNIERLLKLQNRATRIILQADYNTPAPSMFTELGWQSIPKGLIYNKAILTNKALNNLTPAYISNLFKPLSPTHNRSLRSSDNGLLAIPRSRTAQSYGIHCLSPWE